MQPELARFLARHRPRAEGRIAWGNAPVDAGVHLTFRVTGYLTGELPPLEYVTSVRGIVFCGERVLCREDEEGLHLMPGGRRDAGETLQETLLREVREESGCHLLTWSQLGFMQFHHLSPAPAGYRYPYPDFLQIVYLAMAAEPDPALMASPSGEAPFELRPVSEVQALELTPIARLFFDTALRARSAAA